MIKIELKYVVSHDEEGLKIAKIITNKLNISTRLLTKLKMNEKILANGIPVYSNHIVKCNDVIKVKIDFIEQDYITPEKMDLEILFEDEYILAVNKPANMVVHPSSNHLSNTLANGVKYYLNNGKKIRPINRLDKDTSGVVLFAKNQYIQELMITSVDIKKEYIAIVEGIIQEKIGTINLPIARKEGSIMERCVSVEGQKAITHYKVLHEIDDKLSVIKLRLETGRTHQIRVHLAHLGAPIIGDSLYGTTSNLINRQALHSWNTEFIHPITKKLIKITAPFKEDMKKILTKYVIKELIQQDMNS